MSHIVVGLSLAVSNYAYQACSANPDYAVAMERSWFQFGALLAVWIAGRILSAGEHQR